MSDFELLECARMEIAFLKIDSDMDHAMISYKQPERADIAGLIGC